MVGEVVEGREPGLAVVARAGARPGRGRHAWHPGEAQLCKVCRIEERRLVDRGMRNRLGVLMARGMCARTGYIAAESDQEFVDGGEFLRRSDVERHRARRE